MTRRPPRRPAQQRPKPRPRASRSAPNGERTYKIGEAARLLGVEPYVLRFWETQFSFLRPSHAGSTHRIYLDRDLELLRLIKRLLHEERFTIEGARKHIGEHGIEALIAGKIKAQSAAVSSAPRSAEPGQADPRLKRTLGEIRRELESLQKMLNH